MRLRKNKTPTGNNIRIARRDATDEQKKANMETANVNMIRISIYLSETLLNKTIVLFIERINVQIGMYCLQGANTKRGFPTPNDTSAVRAQANAFFKYYAGRKKSNIICEY
jgi:hypothetical protein